MIITSSNNEIFKMLKSLRQKKYRQKEQAVLVEGERTIRQLIALGVELEYIILNETVEDNPFSLKTLYLSNALFSKLSDTVHSQGIMALLSLKKLKTIPSSNKAIIVLDRLQDPGNVGTILRTAKALAYTDILFLKGSVDLYNPKLLRSSMGAAFSLNIKQDVTRDDFIQDCQRENRAIIATSLNFAKPLSERTYYEKSALVFGNEANGVAEEILLAASERLYIEMEDFESLNVAISAGIFLYELAK